MARRSLFVTLCVILLIGLISAQPPVGSPTNAEEVAKTTGDAARAQAERDDEEYYKLLKLFADTIDQVERNYVKKVSRRELIEAAIKGVMSKLDQHSNYISPKDVERFRRSVENEFGGIGIQVGIRDGKLIIISPLYGTPAYNAGLLAGDHITAIEGKTTKGITLDEAVKRLKGKVGESVKLTVKHAHQEKPETVTVKRETVRVETVMGDHRKDDDAWDFMLDKDNKIGYVRVNSFGRHTAEELRSALDDLKAKGMKGLVLDLRYNPGGLLSSAIEICDMFVAKGVIVSVAGRDDTPVRKKVYSAKKQGTLPDFPMVILVNRFSASASEIVSACLQDHKRAIVVGERTWGKGSVQNIIKLEDGASAMKLTTAGYMRPNGENIDRKKAEADAKNKDLWGVRPDKGFEIKFSDEEHAKVHRQRQQRYIIQSKNEPEDPKGEKTEPEFVDRQLQKALGYLEKLVGKTSTASNEKKAPAEKKTVVER